MSTSTPARPWYTRIGPGLITACVVIGPGSILTSSKVGANNGYAMLWIVVASVIFMWIYMSLGAALGVVSQDSPGDLIKRKAGRWLAALVGGAVFFISAAYQSGNNIGVAAAFESYVPEINRLLGISTKPEIIISALLILFNVIAISFLYMFRDMYKALERLMMFFVGLMLVCFAANLIALGPNPRKMLDGFIPSTGRTGFGLELLGLVGTTFTISAAFYQTYLVRQKGWTQADLQVGMIDVRVGSIIMALITMMLMSTAAAGLYTGEDVELTSPVAVATSLEPLFGESGKLIFCLGLFSAAYSSFLVNSMIGGFMAADGFGWGSKPTDPGPRALTTVVLLTGLAVGLAVIAAGWDRTPTIIAAQALTVVAAPLVAGVLFWLTSSRDVMGDQVSTPVQKVIASIGLAVLIGIGGKTAFVDLPKTINDYRAKQAASAAPATPTGDDSTGDEDAAP